MKISDIEKKLEIEKIIDNKKILFCKNFNNAFKIDISKDVYSSIITNKDYNIIFLKLIPMLLFITLIPVVFFPLVIFLKEQVENQFFSFIIISSYFFLLSGHIFWVMCYASSNLIDKACHSWINNNKIKMKDIIFNNTVVDNDIIIKIKSSYGRNAISFLFKSYGINSVKYIDILNFIDHPQYYDINSSIDKQIELLVENI